MTELGLCQMRKEGESIEGPKENRKGRQRATAGTQARVEKVGLTLGSGVPEAG